MSAPRSIAWSVGGQVATLLASMVSTVVLARVLTPADFGAFAFALTIYSLVQWLLQAGMQTYVVREADLTRQKLNAAFAAASAQGIISTLVIIVLAPVAGWFSHLALVGWVTLWVAIVPALCAPEGVTDGLWLREGRYAAVAVLQIAKTAVQTIVSVAVQFAFHAGPYSLVAGLLAYAFVSFGVSVYSLIAGYGSLPFTDRAHWAAVRSFGTRSLLLTLGQVGAMRVPDFIIGRVLNVSTLGHYNRASTALDMITRTLSMALTRALVPRFFRRAQEGHPLRDEVGDLCDALLFFTWPAMAGLAILAAPVVRLIYGPNWLLAGEALPYLCAAYALDLMRTGGMETLTIRDRIGYNAKIEFFHAIYTIALVAMAAPFGIFPVLWAKIVESLVTLLLYYWVLRRHDALPLGRLWAINGGNALYAVAAGAPAFLLMAHWHWPRELDFGQFTLAITSSIALWLSALATTRHPFFLRGWTMATARVSRIARA